MAAKNKKIRLFVSKKGLLQMPCKKVRKTPREVMQYVFEFP